MSYPGIEASKTKLKDNEFSESTEYAYALSADQ